MEKIICFLLSCFVAIQAQFVIERGERDVFRNLTSCSEATPDFCYFLHADTSASDPCICRCKVKYPLYRNPDVTSGQPGEFISKGKPGCVWHSNHRSECFHIRKLGRGRQTNDDEEALEFDLSKPGSYLAFSDRDLTSCTGIDTSIKMPEDSEFTSKPGLLNATYEPDDVIRFNWAASAEKYDGGLLRGVLTGCEGNILEGERCFVGKIMGMYNGGECSVRALNGQCCILPFKYNGRVYNNCTRDGGVEAWCPVRLPFSLNEENWRQNCTNSSNIISTSSPVVQSPTPPRETMISRTMSSHSLLELKTTQILKATETIKRPILGIIPGPDSRLVTRENKTSEVPGTNLLSGFHVSSTAVKVTATASASLNKSSTNTSNKSAVIEYKSSVSRPTMVNYTSSVSDNMPYNHSSMIDHRSSINYTSSIIDQQITRSSDFVVKSINFTSSVSGNKVSMINFTVPGQSTIDYRLSASDHMSSIIDHLKQSIIHSTRPASDYTSSIIDHFSSVTVPEQSIIDYTHSSIHYTSLSSVSKLPMSDHRSRMSDYISSISDYKTSMSPQTTVAPTKSEVSLSLSSSITPNVSAAESDTDSIAIVVIIVMAAVTFAVVAFVSCLFLCRRHWKSRTKKYKVIEKKPGTQTIQSPTTENPSAESTVQNEAVVIDESDFESEIAETEFTIPEKDEQETSERPSGRYYGPSFMTFRL